MAEEDQDLNSEIGDTKPKKTKLPKKARPKPESDIHISDDFDQPPPELLGPIDDDFFDLHEAKKPASVKVLAKPQKVAKPVEVKPKKKAIKSKPAEPKVIETRIDTIRDSVEVKAEIPEITAEVQSEEKQEEKVSEIPEAQPEAPEPSQPQQPSSANIATPGLMKWFLMGLIIAILVGSGFYIYLTKFSVQNNEQVTGLAVYEPSDLLKGWQLAESGTNLAEIPSNLRAEWMTQGVEDGAFWHYEKEDDDLFVWLRIYPDRETLVKNDNTFMSPFVMKSAAYVGIGDKARMGIYTGNKGASPPLLLYVEKDATMLYFAYYNENDSYNNTKIFDDERFLVGLGREMLVKLFGESSVPEEPEITDAELVDNSTG